MSGLSQQNPAVPRICLDRDSAALALSMSRSSFERHVMPTVPVIRKGKLRLYLVADLQRWAENNAEHLGVN